MALEHVGNALARFSAMSFAGIPALTLLHAISTSWNFRRNLGKIAVSPLEALVATFILAFGGSTMTGNGCGLYCIQLMVQSVPALVRSLVS